MTGLTGFAHPWLLSGLALLAVPILIHLWNRYRFRRVRFAAMEFLRESQRRHRRRIWWEQLLLLLLRCALIALVVIALARPQATGSLASLLGAGGTTDHWIVWDDSASMGQEIAGTTPHALAKQRILDLVDELSRQSGQHRVTLLRSTQPSLPLADRELVDRSLVNSWKGLVESVSLSWESTSPALALQTIDAALAAGTPAAIHILSDFTRKDWQEDIQTQEAARRLDAKNVRLRLIDLVTKPADNVGIIDIAIDRSPPPAGVPFTATVAVRNHSNRPVSRLTVTPRWNGRALPARVIDEIAPSEEKLASMELIASTAGVHELAIQIDADPFVADDVRYAAVMTPDTVPVLLVDDTPDRRESMYLALALAPGGDAVTGVAPDVRNSAEAASLDLSSYRSIFLLNLPKIDREWGRALRTFVQEGGGLAIFMGDQVNSAQYNEVLGSAEISLLPGPLLTTPLVDRSSPDEEGDLRPADDPLWEPLAQERNSYLQTVRVDRYWQVDEKNILPSWKRVLNHRDRSPLWMASNQGKGRVLISLTSAGDSWTSWPQNPSYVVGMLRLQDFLSSPVVDRPESNLGEPWNLRWNLTEYRADATLRRPASSEITEEPLRAQIDGTSASITVAGIATPGVYRVQQTRADGTTRERGHAFNLDPKEGDLSKVGKANLEEIWKGIEFDYITSSERDSWRGPRSLEAKDAILMILLLILVAEQALSLRLGYHRRDR
jgi:hypothetical protein